MKNMRISAKGFLLLGLGGMKNIELANELHNKIVEHLTKTNTALVVFEGKLVFADLPKPKKRKWFNFL